MRDHKKEYARLISNNPEYRSHRNERLRKRRSLEVNRARERRSTTAYRERHPERERAKRAIRSALEKGWLTRPERCEKCGRDPGPRSDGRSQIHAHHEDYSRPLCVTWMCIHCHTAEHSRARGGVNEQG